MTTTQNFAGKYFLVSGHAGEHEVFIGKAIDEPFNNYLLIEGKAITYTPQGFMNVKPFTTTVNLPTQDPRYKIQQVTHPEARNEVQKILTNNVNQVFRATYPYTYRWVETCFTDLYNTNYNGNYANRGYGYNNFNRYAHVTTNPFFSTFEGFVHSAEQFRRILFQAPQVSSSREMDKVTELEGNLQIELGKTTNQIAVKFNQVVAREAELKTYFEAIQTYYLPISTTNHVGGWVYLFTRMQMAKNWAQRNGKAPLVREINTFIKEGINNLNDAMLEHCATLDMLITETCTQYGIVLETFGELSPFTSYLTPYNGVVDTIDTPTRHLVGANI
jgi:hypothetical protein